MIRADLVVPDAERSKVRSRHTMERSGIISELEARLEVLNPDFRRHDPQIGVVQTVQTTDVLVTMTADCDPIERLELPPGGRSLPEAHEPLVIEGTVE